MIICSRPLFFGVVIDLRDIESGVLFSEFSSPVLRGSYRSEIIMKQLVLMRFSSPVLRGSYRSGNLYFIRPPYKEFSSPVLRGSYRSDTLINSITTRVQVLFWLSKIVTTNTMLLYEMSLFLTNIIMIFFTLKVYYI